LGQEAKKGNGKRRRKKKSTRIGISGALGAKIKERSSHLNQGCQGGRSVLKGKILVKGQKKNERGKAKNCEHNKENFEAQW